MVRLSLSKTLMLVSIGLITISSSSTIAYAGQGSQAVQTTQVAPTADVKDVASIDSIIAALYDVISGPAGKKRDWDRMRSLFATGARLIPTVATSDGGFTARMLTVEDYITRSGDMLEKNGFFEREVARRSESFGRIAQVFSTYESRRTAEDKTPFARGINSIQLMNDGKRWWIVTVFWQGEDAKNPLPPEYLKSKNE
ncbi:MAG TPA: hypothetical protein VJH03_00475 [Blastocatellia bacterium]|nr:hypothetical protein [Blastocatellia bacterium]